MIQDISTVTARRRLYLSLAQKRVKPGSGSSLSLLLARTWRQPVFDLRTLFTVPFVVMGGVATRLYSPERMTDDLDILVHADHAAQVAREASECGHLLDGARLDVTLSGEKWAE